MAIIDANDRLMGSSRRRTTGVNIDRSSSRPAGTATSTAAVVAATVAAAVAVVATTTAAVVRVAAAGSTAVSAVTAARTAVIAISVVAITVIAMGRADFYSGMRFVVARCGVVTLARIAVLGVRVTVLRTDVRIRAAGHFNPRVVPVIRTAVKTQSAYGLGFRVRHSDKSTQSHLTQCVLAQSPIVAVSALAGRNQSNCKTTRDQS
jgi:hypothetical protein